MSDQYMKPSQPQPKKGDKKVLILAGVTVAVVLVIVSFLQDPAFLRSAMAENEAHYAAMQACAEQAHEDIGDRMAAGEFTRYGAFIRMPGAQLRCLRIHKN